MASYKIVEIADFKCYVEAEIADNIKQQIEAMDIAAKLLDYEVKYFHTTGEGSSNKKININFKQNRSTKFRLSLSFDGNKILRRVTLKYSNNGLLNATIDSYQSYGVDLEKPLAFLCESL